MGRRAKTTKHRAAIGAGVAECKGLRLMPWDEVAAEFNRLTGESIGRTGAQYIGDRAAAKVRAALLPWAEAYGLVPAAER